MENNMGKVLILIEKGRLLKAHGSREDYSRSERRENNSRRMLLMMMVWQKKSILERTYETK